VFQADVEADVAAAGVPKKRTFKKFSFRGVDLDALLDMSTDDLVKLFPARARRRYIYVLYILNARAWIRVYACVFMDVSCMWCWREMELGILSSDCGDAICRFQRGLKRKPMALIKKLRKAVRSTTIFFPILFFSVLDDIIRQFFLSLRILR
jgi:hypothetical protein